MAAIEGLSEAQNASLAGVEVGNLILIDQDLPDSDYEGDSNSNKASDDGSDEGNDDDELSESDDEESSSESQNDSEHIEDVSRVDSATSLFGSYRALRTVEDPNQDLTRDHPITVYLVLKVRKNSKGIVNDIFFTPLSYSAQADASPSTFQLYGKQCVPSASAGSTSDQSTLSTKESINICDLPGGETLKFAVSPQGDHVRSVVLDHECPACDEGFVNCITQLAGMVKDYTIPTSKINEPAVCPSCIGIDLMKEHQDLRAELEAFSFVSDFSAIHAFYARLAVRRRELGYYFYQFDERKWGYMFDDMESEDGGDGGNNQGFEHWDEATDPSNGATLHPASDATIKSLPIKRYAEVKTEDDVHCVVCREEFKDDQLVMQLPCKHFFCGDGCTVQWLKQYDTCPMCRAKVPAVEEKSKPADNTVKPDAVPEVQQVSTASEPAASTDRDDDVTMVDAW